jgi:hypothetical protein
MCRQLIRNQVNVPFWRGLVNGLILAYIAWAIIASVALPFVLLSK